jgi:hypothetical protein
MNGSLLFVHDLVSDVSPLPRASHASSNHTSLAPLYGYLPRGKRTFFKVPRNTGTTTTLLASMG